MIQQPRINDPREQAKKTLWIQSFDRTFSMAEAEDSAKAKKEENKEEDKKNSGKDQES